MKKTKKMANVKEPYNYWITRRIYEDENGNEGVKVQGYFYTLEELRASGWSIDVYF